MPARGKQGSRHQTSEFCDRLILLREGRIYKMGAPQEVITKETIETVYGCDVWVDQNPVLGMPRISLLRKGVHEIETVGRD